MSKKNIRVVSVFALLLLCVVVGVVFGVRKGGEKKSKDGADATSQISMSSKAITVVCEPTDYKETCVNSLKDSSAGNTSDPKELIRVGFRVAATALKDAMNNLSSLKELAANDSRTSQALENCEELMDSAIDDMENSFDKMGDYDLSKIGEYIDELNIWLSGAITFEESCLDEFENITNSKVGEKLKNILQVSTELTSNGLAMVTGISSVLTSLTISRRLLASDEYYFDRKRSFPDKNGYPSWVTSGRRKLLQATPATIKADAIVAQDGSGQFKTITDALNTVPKDNAKTFVIYIKSGVYHETVTVTKEMKNVMFIGDGPTKTKITGNKNYVDGIQTMSTATVCK
ncbi:hypothetical protein Q3G72_027466 [Acer saccharum]|nr:hypothetical protein Q3G72_027466 [Acer saccharum]